MATASDRAALPQTDEARALKILEGMPGHAWAADAAGRLTYVSPQTCAFLGSSWKNIHPDAPDDEFGWRSVIHPEDYERAAAKWRHSLRTGDHYDTEYRLRRADGVYRWFRNSGRPSYDSAGDIVGWFGTTVDIEEMKQAEAELTARERRLAHLVDMMPGHVWRLMPDGEPVFFNKRMIDFLGLDVTDLNKPGRTRLEVLFEAVHPDDAAELKCALHQCLATGQVLAQRCRLRRADGVYRWMSIRGEPVRDDSGRIVQWYCLAFDIDDQAQAEEALRRREHQLQHMIDAVPVCIWSTTQTGAMSYFNKRFQDYFRSVLAEFDSLNQPNIEWLIEHLAHPDEAADAARALANSFQSGSAALIRFRRREHDGEYRWTELRVEPQRDKDGSIAQWYGVSLGVDDEVKAQKELQQASDRLARATQAAALAELSASIAHEVNQPLAAIVANSHACQRWLGSEPPNLERARGTVGRIIRNAHTAASVVSRVRALFKQTIEGRRRSTLDAVITEARGLLAQSAAKNHAAIKARVDGDVPPICFDRVQIQQVLINLMCNALEAMRSSEGPRTVCVGVRRDDDSIRVEVSDTGPGIEHPERVFDPFFTTKANGMGMGLAISRSIVESHGGQLWAESERGHGATFVFTLPIESPGVP